MKLNSLNIIKHILPQHSIKHVPDWCQKKHLLCTICRSPRTVFSKQLGRKCQYICANVLNNSRKVFHFNEIFGNKLFFSISILPSIALKRWSFPDNLDLKVSYEDKLSNKRKEDFLYIWLLQRITLSQRSRKSHL